MVLTDFSCLITQPDEKAMDYANRKDCGEKQGTKTLNTHRHNQSPRSYMDVMSTTFFLANLDSSWNYVPA